MTDDALIGISLDGRYRIIKKLGGGSFGRTYLAEDTRLIGRPLCLVKQLKPIRSDPSTLKLARRLFELEAKKLEELSGHGQIPRILAYFEENDEFYLVQDFIEGHTLSTEIVPHRKLSESYVIAFLQGSLEPLAHVHRNNVIHRDIKPDNLMRREKDGKIFLIDFGAVKEIPVTEVTSQGQSKITVVIGTQGYMPSEQFNGKPRFSSDIYALGMTAIYALTGIPPKSLPIDSKTLEVKWRHLAQVNPLLGDFLAKMVCYDYRHRFVVATDALQQITEIASMINKSEHHAVASYTTEPTEIALPNSKQLNHQLTLEWVEKNGQTKNQVILENQLQKNQKPFRIGRDAQKCDLIFPEVITVSREHIEIFFNSHDRRFYLRSLRDNNPPEIDGQKIKTTTEIALKQGDTIKLGELTLKVHSVGTVSGETNPNSPENLISSNSGQKKVVLPTQKMPTQDEEDESKPHKPIWKFW